MGAGNGRPWAGNHSPPMGLGRLGLIKTGTTASLCHSFAGDLPVPPFRGLAGIHSSKTSARMLHGMPDRFGKGPGSERWGKDITCHRKAKEMLIFETAAEFGRVLLVASPTSGYVSGLEAQE